MCKNSVFDLDYIVADLEHFCARCCTFVLSSYRNMSQTMHAKRCVVVRRVVAMSLARLKSKDGQYVCIYKSTDMVTSRLLFILIYKKNYMTIYIYVPQRSNMLFDNIMVIS
jgi:hypothetical protein